MALNEIKTLNVKGISGKECVLFLWTINKFLYEAYDVARSWGFNPSTMLVWCKNPNGIGLGGTFSITTEYLLFAWKGKCGAKKRFDTTWWLEKRGKHSQKPERFRDIIETAFPGINKIELFAREKTPGWDVWGNEVKSDINLAP